jgi:capsular polysaccharide transport system permease protein
LKARKPLSIFLAVQKALFLRELGMRFSVSRSGLFWTFFEPFMQVMVMVLIKVVLFGRSNTLFDFSVFLALNFTAYNMFKNILTKSMGSFKANKGLFVYKQVKPIDTIIARTLVELFLTGVIILFFLLIGLFFHYDMAVQNLPLVTLGFLWLALFGLALGIFMAVGNTFYPSLGRTLNIIMTFIMFGSAVFYTLEMLPRNIQAILLYNPLVHFMEMIHGNYFLTLSDSFVDYDYMTLWTVILLYLGLFLYHHLEERIISL